MEDMAPGEKSRLAHSTNEMAGLWIEEKFLNLKPLCHLAFMHSSCYNLFFKSDVVDPATNDPMACNSVTAAYARTVAYLQHIYCLGKAISSNA